MTRFCHCRDQTIARARLGAAGLALLLLAGAATGQQLQQPAVTPGADPAAPQPAEILKNAPAPAPAPAAVVKESAGPDLQAHPSPAAAAQAQRAARGAEGGGPAPGAATDAPMPRPARPSTAP